MTAMRRAKQRRKAARPYRRRRRRWRWTKGQGGGGLNRLEARGTVRTALVGRSNQRGWSTRRHCRLRPIARERAKQGGHGLDSLHDTHRRRGRLGRWPRQDFPCPWTRRDAVVATTNGSARARQPKEAGTGIGAAASKGPWAGGMWQSEPSRGQPGHGAERWLARWEQGPVSIGAAAWCTLPVGENSCGGWRVGSAQHGSRVNMRHGWGWWARPVKEERILNFD
jgi:hypothetical protein